MTPKLTTAAERERLLTEWENFAESCGLDMYLYAHKAQANRRHSRLYRTFMVTMRRTFGNPCNGWFVIEWDTTWNAWKRLWNTIKFIRLSYS